MSKKNTAPQRKALSAEDFSAQFRSDPENERRYREAEARLDLAERMSEMRHSSELSQQHLADRVGRKQSFIARLESGAYEKCNIGTLRTFALAMGYDLDVASMFKEIRTAQYTGRSSCGNLEQSFELLEKHSEKLASISLAAWERSELPRETAAPKQSAREVTETAA